MATHFVITAAWRDTVAKLLIVLIVCISLAGFSQAKTRCNQVTPILRQCTSEADFSRFSQSYASQRMSQWCWAASVSMLFRYFGHPLSQEKIVMAQYGRVVNLPAGNGF